MQFQKSPPELVARFDELAALAPEATRKLMFGYPSLVLGGHMFMSLYEDHVVLRLGGDDRAALFALGGQVFEPMPGRPMTGYVLVPDAIVADAAEMAGWVERALGQAASLPPKKPKKPKKQAPKGG
jgi:TfoX/Sxy family transcriptional regulator of competence genes